MKTRLFTKLSAILLVILINFTSFIPFLSVPKMSYAQDNSCGVASNSIASASNNSAPLPKIAPRVGGVALNQAAKFLADMSEVTGAYYDANLDRIVFVGKKSATLPKFDKDDLAVAIKAIMFEGELPYVSIDSTNPDPNLVNARYSKGIENTKFGDILIKADWEMKKYGMGVDENGNVVTSNVPGYKSFGDRYYLNPNYNPQIETGNYSSRWWIVPQLISLKEDGSAKSFIFDTVKMEVRTEPTAENSSLWNQAAQEQADNYTQNYDLYAAEKSSWADTKRLGQIAAVVKWINDAGIITDFYWARDYATKVVNTPKTFPKFDSKKYPYQYTDGQYIIHSGTSWLSGGADLGTPNTRIPDTTGTSSALKTSAQAVPTTKEDIHWQFNNGGQQYEAVAVAADAFRSLGSYNETVTDMSFPTTGDLNLSFDRTYSSFSGGQYGVGRGWSIYPAQLFDNNPSFLAKTLTCANGLYPKSLALVSQTGGFESFTITDCNIGYVPDDPAYHSKIARNADGSFTATLKDQTKLNFNSNYKLTSVKDKNDNPINYTYDTDKKLTSISDGKGHQINLTYNTDNLISSITDFSGRSVNYTYDGDGNLLTVKDPNNNITTYTYDANFKLTTVTDRNGTLVLTNTYTDEAKVATSKNAANITNTNTYDKVNRVITTVDNNARTQVTKYDPKGRVLEYTDPLLSKLIYTYGTEFSPLTIKDKRGNTIANTYDPNGNLTQITFPDTKKVNYQYDAFNRLTKILDGRYGVTTKDTTNTYDAAGNLTQSDKAGQLTKFTYDQQFCI